MSGIVDQMFSPFFTKQSGRIEPPLSSGKPYVIFRSNTITQLESDSREHRDDLVRCSKPASQARILANLPSG